MKSAIILLASVILTCGCIKSRMDILVLPDGSGKVHFTVSYRKDLLSAPDTDSMINNAGFAAVTEWTRQEEGAWVRLDAFAYFKDINLCNLSTAGTSQEADESPSHTFDFKTKSGFPLLTIKRHLKDANTAYPGGVKFDQEEKILLGEIEFAETYRILGNIFEIKGEAVQQDNTVVPPSLTGDQLIRFFEKGGKPKMWDKLSIYFRPDSQYAQEILAFKKEMADAIQDMEKDAHKTHAANAEAVVSTHKEATACAKTYLAENGLSWGAPLNTRLMENKHFLLEYDTSENERQLMGPRVLTVSPDGKVEVKGL